MDKKKVMILGAGNAQIELYRAAKEAGYETVAVSIEGNYPGFDVADEIRICDITDEGGVSALARELKVDGVTSACRDIALMSIGKACDDNGLPGLSYQAARVSTDKALMKDAFEKAGVRTAKHMRVNDKSQLPQVLEELGMPLITKAVDLSGSRGINIAFKEEELLPCYEKTMEATNEDYCVIEQYLIGYECSASALVCDGEVMFVLPTGDLRYGENDELPIGHYIPYEDDEDILKQIEEEMVRGIKAIGLDNCAVNADLMIADGKVYLIEMTGRIGGNTIPELTSMYYGIDVHRLIIETAVGNIEAVREMIGGIGKLTPCCGQILFSNEAGTLESITVDETWDDAREKIWVFAKPGDQVRKFKSSNDFLGRIVVAVDEGTDRFDAINKAIGKVNINLN